MSDQCDVLIKTMTHFHKTIQFAQVSGQILFVVHVCQYHHSRTERWQEKQRLCSLGQFRVPCKTCSLDVASSRNRLINGLCQTHLAMCANVVTKVDMLPWYPDLTVQCKVQHDATICLLSEASQFSSVDEI